MSVYGNYKMYLWGISGIWRDVLDAVVPLCGSVPLACEDTLEDFGFLLCCSYLCV
jgi:hypothetical protein